jgi:hypothetical protein
LPDAVTTSVSSVSPLMSTPFNCHWLPVGELLVSVTSPPAQKLVGPDAEIVGAVGAGSTCTAIAADSVAQPLASV